MVFICNGGSTDCNVPCIGADSYICGNDYTDDTWTCKVGNYNEYCTADHSHCDNDNILVYNPGDSNTSADSSHDGNNRHTANGNHCKLYDSVRNYPLVPKSTIPVTLSKR